MVTTDRWETKHERLFRDWLIEDPEAARAYALLKRGLAARFAGDREAYTSGKDDFVRETVNLARRARGLDPETDWDE